MSSPVKFLLVLLLLIAGAAMGAWYFLAPQVPVVVPPVEPGPAIQQPEVPTQPSQPVVSEPVTAPQEPVRQAAQTDLNQAHADAKQGIRGRVLLPNGAAAAQVPVFLMESSVNDPIRVYLATKTGKITPPVAACETDAQGNFALGVLQAGKTFDVRVTPVENPDVNHQGVKVREDDWIDIGAVQLELGQRVTGRVIEETSKAGVANATVFMQDSQQSHSMVPTPGRERGVQVQTDNTGYFQFRNAPKQGMVNLSAEVKGYASSPLLNQPIKADAANEFTLEVTRGQPISGVVVDADGKPIVGATVMASGLSMKTPQAAQTASGADGWFEFPALREGPYQLTTTTPQFEESKVTPIMTGETEVKIVLQQRAYAKLRVQAATGGAVRAYKLALKRYFPNNPLGIGNVPEFAERRVTPADYDGEWAVIRGLPVGEFVFQITDKDHAKSLSIPFTIASGGNPPEVEAKLTLGAIVAGRVVDDRGQPVAGATVSTDMNGALGGDGGGFFEIFRSFLPEKHTKATATTNRNGEFKIAKLAYADYLVRVNHPDFCEGAAADISLANEGQVHDVGTLVLARGAIVEGSTAVGGEAMGQIKVTVTTQPPQASEVPLGSSGQPQPLKPGALFSATVMSNPDGSFKLLKRVPPGSYKIHASRQSGDNNPFKMLLDMKQSEQVLTIRLGQEQAQINFNLERQ